MVKVHEGVMLPGHVGVRGLNAAEFSPWLELLVQPVFLAAAERDGVEDIEDG